MKKLRPIHRKPHVKKVACTVSAAALMLGVSHAATVAMHFQENYCGSARYSGFPVTLTAFGIAPAGWQNLTPMDTGYGSCAGHLAIYNLNETINTTTSTGGLNPLPNGSLSVSWSANAANFSGFAGYGGKPPNYGYDGTPPVPIPTGEWQIYSTFLRDGKNFGPIDNNADGAPCGDNSMPPYTIDITGLKSVFTNTPFVVELIAASDSMQTLTNAFVIDVLNSVSNSVTYPNTPFPTDEGGTCSQWLRGHGGGLSTVSASLNVDHIKITSAQPQHGGTGTPPTGFDAAGTISGFIITDKPVITMSPQTILCYPGDTVTVSAYAIGVAPLHYQWRKNGVPIPGATTSSYSVANLSIGNAGNYDVVVTNSYGSATSAASFVSTGIIESQVNGLVADSNTSNPERDGLNNGATWLASSSDGTVNRTGVMQFVAANANGITVSGSTNFDSSTGTYSFWVRSAGTDTSSGAIGAALFGRPGSSLASDLVLVQDDSGVIDFNAPGSGTTANSFSSSKQISDNKWHLITLTYDQSITGNATLYIDGVLDTASLNGAAWANPTGQPIQIGFISAGGLRNYDGILDDVRVYNRQLTAAEVLTLFNTGGVIDASALQMEFNFTTAPVEGLSLSWATPNSVLQSATVASGAYADVGGAVSPYLVVPKAAQKYYRFRYPSVAPSTKVTNPYLM
jgi:hypothetical protein